MCNAARDEPAESYKPICCSVDCGFQLNIYLPSFNLPVGSLSNRVAFGCSRQLVIEKKLSELVHYLLSGPVHVKQQCVVTAVGL